MPTRKAPPVKAKAKGKPAPVAIKIREPVRRKKPLAAAAPVPEPAGEAPPHRGAGRPKHVPDEKNKQRVTVWSSAGIAQDLIARTLNIDKKTLTKHYGEELETGKAVIDGLAVSTLVVAMQRGGKEAVSAAKWWTQSRMGWSERLIVEDDKLHDTPMRVIVELVGDGGEQEAKPKSRPRADGSHLMQLVG